MEFGSSFSIACLHVEGTGIGAGCTAFGDTYAGILLLDAGESIVVGRFTVGDGVLGQLEEGLIGP